jgi:hypothetical protein
MKIAALVTLLLLPVVSFAEETTNNRILLDQVDPALPGSGKPPVSVGENLVRNGDFENPLTDKLALWDGKLSDWEIKGATLVVNHLRLFPFSGFQCLAMRSGAPSQISQEIEVKKPGKLTISFALAASRIVGGEVVVLLDDKPVGSRRYSDYWKPEETRFTDHMRWVEVDLPAVDVEPGKHRITFQAKDCQKLVDKQGDTRQMIDGILLDSVRVTLEEKKQFSGIPYLDDLAAQIVPTSTLTCYPMIGNFLGGLKASKCIGAFDPEWLHGFQGKGTMGKWQVDEQVLTSETSQWFPYQIVSRADVGGVGATGTIRLAFERPGVLVKLTLANQTSKEQIVPLTLTLPSDKVVADPSNTSRLLITDQWDFTFTRAPQSVTANQAAWTLKLAPGERVDLGYAMERRPSSLKSFDEVGFNEAFAKCKTDWAARWKDVFTPGNPSYSGYLPTFKTDDRGLYEIYYLSIVSMLETQQNNVYPLVKRAFGTNNQWANWRAYFWDFSLVSDIYAMLDPDGMKQVIALWLAVDQNKCNAVRFEDGKPMAPWYAVNDYSIFKFVDSYIRVTRDTAFLQTKIKDQTVMEHLRRLSGNTEKRFNARFGLVDFGGDCWSFFECNPDYKYMAPAMNAQVVWTLRTMADYEKRFGSPAVGDQLLQNATALAGKVKSLYVPGEGVWQVQYPDGRKFVSRHSYDFLTLAMTMNQDLDAKTKQEMVGFVERELLTDSHFLRAMSESDAQAPHSDRSDHGPKGSYIAWPALTIQGMADLGEYPKAAHILSDFRKAFEEGGMGQAIEFLTVPGTNRIINRVGERAGASFIVCGSSFAGTIIDGLMGYHPGLDGSLKLRDPGIARGFNGRLTNVRYGDKNYTIDSDSSGIRASNGLTRPSDNTIH